MKSLCYSTLLLVTFAAPAFASVTVSAPAIGAQVTSPFTLSASAANCSSQNTSSMGYSLDSSSATTVVTGTSVEAEVVSGLGAHTLHVKAWGDAGSSCVTDVAITVDPAARILEFPSDAATVRNLQVMSSWVAQNDAATSGSSSGVTSLVNAPSMSGNARTFVSDYKSYGGQRFNVSFGDDTIPTHFFYDAWIYLPSPSTPIANIEMDMNQVMANGQTVIYGFQCDGWSGTWDYTANTGTPVKFVDTWIHSKAPCNPHQWKTNTWHHIQISYFRDDSGNVTYQSVWFDGAESTLNVTVPSAFALGWAPTLLTNFQLDGYLATSGAAIAYLDDLTISRW